MLIAPTEPRTLIEIGACSSKPEDYGADILWQSELGLVGIQRKVFPGDFLKSVHDGRLYKEYQQMKGLDLAVLLLEGKGRWTTEGILIKDHGDIRYGWTRDQHRHYLTSVQRRGIVVQETDSLRDTIAFLEAFREWTDKGDHDSLERRPGPEPEIWGSRLSDRDYILHLIQSLPKVGPKKARMLLDTHGNPFKLTLTEEEIAATPGFGKILAKRIVRLFNGEES